MYAISYLLKLQIDHLILDGHGQACPGMSKKAFETDISQNLSGFKSCSLDPCL